MDSSSSSPCQYAAEVSMRRGGAEVPPREDLSRSLGTKRVSSSYTDEPEERV